jgi:hypothetical protein
MDITPVRQCVPTPHLIAMHIRINGSQPYMLEAKAQTLTL